MGFEIPTFPTKFEVKGSLDFGWKLGGVTEFCSVANRFIIGLHYGAV